MRNDAYMPWLFVGLVAVFLFAGLWAGPPLAV